MNQINPITKIIENHGLKPAAVLLGVSYQFVRKMEKNWEKQGVPAERVLDIAEKTDYMVSCHELRPDLYPLESWCQCPACLRNKEAA